MEFEWKPYSAADVGVVDCWLDARAIEDTGLENGWRSFYHYWMLEDPSSEGRDRCYLIGLNGDAIGVLYLAVQGGTVTISEFLLAPDFRGRGYGARVLQDLLNNLESLVSGPIGLVRAVTLPGNAAAIRCFEKAGFQLAANVQDDAGQSLHYEYGLDQTQRV